MSATQFREEDLKGQLGYAKSTVLKDYLNAWFQIMLNHYGHAVYVDGFPGPGHHKNGDEDCPLFVLKSLKNYTGLLTHPTPKIILIFIQLNPKDYDKLKLLMENEISPSLNNIDIQLRFEVGNFDILMDKILYEFAHMPMVVFVNPFAISCKMSTCHAILDTFREGAPKELILSLMEQDVRHIEEISEENAQEYLENLMGADSNFHVMYQEEPASFEKLKLFYTIYIETLKNGYRNLPGGNQSISKIKVVKFALRAKTNSSHVYHFVYASSHLKGVEKIKFAMSRMSLSCDDFAFCEWTPDHSILDIAHEIRPQVQDTVSRIKIYFDLKEGVTGQEIGDFILENTPYQFNTKVELRKELKQFITHADKVFLNIEFSFLPPNSKLEDSELAPLSKSARDKMYKEGVKKIEQHFMGKVVTGGEIENYFMEHVSPSAGTLNSKTRLKSLLKERRIDEVRTREFHKMKFSFVQPLPLKYQPPPLGRQGKREKVELASVMEGMGRIGVGSVGSKEIANKSSRQPKFEDIKLPPI